MLFFPSLLNTLPKLERGAYFIKDNVDSLVQPTHICSPEGFYYFFTKFLRPFVSGTDGVNCLTTKSQPFSKTKQGKSCLAVLSFHIPEDCIIKLLGVIKLIQGLITERYSDWAENTWFFLLDHSLQFYFFH